MHRKLPEPIVMPYPHPSDCEMKQGNLDACTTGCEKCATGAFNYLADKHDEYALEMGLAGALQ